MRVRTSFFVLFSLPWVLCVLLSTSAQFPPDAAVSARLLDAHLQDWAFKALVSPRTGEPYDVQVPTNLTGIKVSAMRLRSGSLRTRGIHRYKEFEIPIGVVEKPFVDRLVLVYQNFGNWSHHFYPLPGFSYLAPVLGLLVYSGANLSASELPKLDIKASHSAILVNFPDVEPAPLGTLAKCVYFDLHGSVQFDVLLPGNVCSTMQQGHFSIAVELNAPSPAPSGGESNQGGGKNKNKNKNKNEKNKSMLKIVVTSVVGGVMLLIILGLLVVGIRRHKEKTRIKKLEGVADGSETLNMRNIGDIRIPLAFGIRTRPMIEHNYFP